MIGDNIKYLRKRAHYSQEQIARKLGLTQGSISSWETNRTIPDTKQFLALANIFGVSTDVFFSDSPLRELDAINIKPSAVPILGTISCGEKITPDTEPEGYTDLPDGVIADFALRCKGDSMAPTLLDGDLVLIRQQPEVENGQIAAVSIDGETTLKHVYKQHGGLALIAENPLYSPINVPSIAEQEIIIHGLAVGYTRLFA